MLSSLFVAVGLCISGFAAKSIDYNTHATRAIHANSDWKALATRALAANVSTAPICKPKSSPPNGDPKLEPQLTLAPGIHAADCISALSGFLKKKNGNWIVQINPTNVKSCGSCKVRLNTTDSGPLWVPLPIIQYGMGDNLDGGLVKLLTACPGHDGAITLAGGSATGGGILVSVSKGSGKANCGPNGPPHDDEIVTGPGPAINGPAANGSSGSTAPAKSASSTPSAARNSTGKP